MNTSRYNKRDFARVQALLWQTENSVFPAEYYSAVAELTGADAEPEKSADGGADGSPSAKKLHKLLTQSHTVIAEEDGKLCGLASMDKEGNLGLLCTDGEHSKKTAKLLIRALERQAEKKGVAKISAAPQESAAKIFKECGYACSEEERKEFDDWMNALFVKPIAEEKPPVNFPPESAKKIVLDGRKPITVEGFDMVFPSIFFGIACFFAMLLTILGIAAKNDGNVYGAENIPLFGIIVGALFFIALGVLIAYIVRGKNIKKRVLAGNVTNGIITDLAYDEYWTYERESDGGRRERHVRVSLTYVFYDEQLNLRTGHFVSKYQSAAPNFYYKQEVAVAYSDEWCYLLRKYTVLSEESLKA